MALKVISGIIQVDSGKEDGGKATIDFATNDVTGDASRSWGDNHAQINGGSRFVGEPCKVLSLRNVSFYDKHQDNAWGTDYEEVDGHWNINDWYGRNYDTLEVEWQGHKGTKVHQISYMIMGEAQ